MLRIEKAPIDLISTTPKSGKSDRSDEDTPLPNLIHAPDRSSKEPTGLPQAPFKHQPRTPDTL